MASNLYQEVVRLAEQLSIEERQALIEHLQKPPDRSLSFEEKQRLLQSMIISTPLANGFSLKREDWYGDDER